MFIHRLNIRYMVSIYVVTVMGFQVIRYGDIVTWRSCRYYRPFCEGYPPVTGAFPSQRVSKAFFLFSFSLLLARPSCEYTVELLVVWDAVRFIRCHYIMSILGNYCMVVTMVMVKVMVFGCRVHDDVINGSASLAICAGNSPAQRPVKQSFDVFFDVRLNIRLG